MIRHSWVVAVLLAVSCSQPVGHESPDEAETHRDPVAPVPRVVSKLLSSGHSGDVQERVVSTGGEPVPGRRISSEWQPFRPWDALADMTSARIADLADLRVLPRQGDGTGPLMLMSNFERVWSGALGRVFDMCDNDDVLAEFRPGHPQRSAVLLFADMLNEIQARRHSMGCDGSKPDPAGGLGRWAVLDTAGNRTFHYSPEAARDHYKDVQQRLGEFYANSAPQGAFLRGASLGGYPVQYPDVDQPVDEVRVLDESVAVRDGVLRGLVRNWSRTHFAYGVTVVADGLEWEWPLSIQPGEAAPFEIENWSGSVDPAEIDFAVEAEMSPEVDISRAWIIVMHPGVEMTGASQLRQKGYPPEVVDTLPKDGTVPFFYGELNASYVDPYSFIDSSLHPSLAEIAGMVVIEDLRGYVAFVEISDDREQVIDVIRIPLLTVEVGINDTTGERNHRHVIVNQYPYKRTHTWATTYSNSRLELGWHRPYPSYEMVWVGGAHK